ncbi:MAG: hypothetical protein ACE5K0_04635, partial [Candidatus Methanofastidiosia archaeon]
KIQIAGELSDKEKIEILEKLLKKYGTLYDLKLKLEKHFKKEIRDDEWEDYALKFYEDKMKE